jgi:tetratricopeptide (TPR) repeat protein
MAYAQLYTEARQYEKAFTEWDEALKAAPDDYNALYQVGKLAATTGQNLDRGLAALRRCVELEPGKDQPTHAAAQWRIGNILEKKNDVAGARAAYEAALKLDPKFTNAADALKKLKAPRQTPT